MLKLHRDYGLSIVLLLASGLLLVVLALEWGHNRFVRTDFEKLLATKPQVKLANPEIAVDSYQLADIQEYGDMIQRPLFMEGRKPAESDIAQVEDAPHEQTPLTVKLMGVVVAPGGKTALFVDQQGKYKRGRKNAVIQGWKLVEIMNDRAVLEQDGQQKELPLLKPKPKTQVPAVAGRPQNPPPPNQPGRNPMVRNPPPGQPAAAVEEPENPDESEEIDQSVEDEDAQSDEAASDNNE